MITTLLSIAATAAAYRAALAATKGAAEGTLRGRLYTILGGGGPGPVTPK